MARTGSPEVNLNRFAFIVGERDFFALGVGEGEGRGLLADEGRLHVGYAALAGPVIGDENGFGLLGKGVSGGLLAILPVGPSGEREQHED